MLFSGSVKESKRPFPATKTMFLGHSRSPQIPQMLKRWYKNGTKPLPPVEALRPRPSPPYPQIMNWLSIIQLILSLSPEVLKLIASIVTAVQAAPAEHQAAIAQAFHAAAAKPAGE